MAQWAANPSLTKTGGTLWHTEPRPFEQEKENHAGIGAEESRAKKKNRAEIEPGPGAPHVATWTDFDRAEGTARAESETGKHTEEKKVNRRRNEHWQQCRPTQPETSRGRHD
jgi:hypothetical protein